MKFKVLGCSGGIGGKDDRTTAFLVDDDILIDCGTGVGALTLDELTRIDHVFLTHAHLDHIAALPLLVDSAGEARGVPLTVYAAEETIRILRTHVFNWLIWPDFTVIPNCIQPYLRFQPIQLEQSVRLGGRTVTPHVAHHTVPSVSYSLDSGQGQLFFTGDTMYSEELVAAINRQSNLRHLLIESAFSDEQHALALASGHLCPSLLATLIEEIQTSPDIHVCHLKPGAESRVLAQIKERLGHLNLSKLCQGQVFEF